MKTRSVRKMVLHKGWMLMLSAAALALGSCVKEAAIEAGGGVTPALPDGKVQLALHTDAGGFEVPVARAGSADETEIYGSQPMVLVFEDAADSGVPADAVFTEAARAEGADGDRKVTLTGNANRVWLLVVANPPAAFYDGTNATPETFDVETLTALLAGETFADAVAMLNTAALADAGGTVAAVPYTPEGYIPLSGLCELEDGIVQGATIGTSGAGAVTLERAVAKVTVHNTAADFTLAGATVVGAKRFGRLYDTPATVHTASAANVPTGNLVDYYATDSGLEVTGIAAATSGNTADNPIYVYESAAGETSVIVQGTYNGATHYYRLALRSKGNTGITDGALLPVLRNRWYKVNITAVSAAGHATAALAAAAEPANGVKADVHVIDLRGHETVDNGQYYLAVSNSAFLYYSETTDQSVTVATITTSATSALGITPSITRLSGPDMGISFPLTFALEASGETGYDLNLTLTAALVQDGTPLVLRVTVGNLSKEITISRRAPLTPVGGALEFGGNYLTGRIGDNSGGWSLSLDGATGAGGEVSRTAAGSIYLLASHNVAQSGAEARNGEVYLYRHGAESRTRALLDQAGINYGEAPLTDFPTTVTPYVGAFWRAAETGERLIRMPSAGSTQTLDDSAKGAWMAFVGDENDGKDWIVLDTEVSGAGASYWQSPAAVVEANAAYQPKNGGTERVSGHTDDGPIYFRIGLKTTLAGANAAPRYGVVYLIYNNSKVHKLYIRQGEAADYLMRPEDKGAANGTWDGESRPNAAKFSAFNLTHPDYKSNSSSAYWLSMPERKDMLTDFAEEDYFTAYPSQGGAFFRFVDTPGYTRAAFSMLHRNSGTSTGTDGSWGATAVSTALWDTYYDVNDTEKTNHLVETCPPGWRRPQNGPTSAAVIFDENNVSTSEIRQSLWLNPPAESNSSKDNVLLGYYADGFFDRRVITTPGITGNTTARSTAAPATTGSAFTGALYFNPYTNASLFMPSAGNRTYDPGGSYGLLVNAGNIGYYQTSTMIESYLSSVYYYSSSLYRSYRSSSSVTYGTYSHGLGISVRCVRE